MRDATTIKGKYFFAYLLGPLFGCYDDDGIWAEMRVCVDASLWYDMD